MQFACRNIPFDEIDLPARRKCGAEFLSVRRKGYAPKVKIDFLKWLIVFYDAEVFQIADDLFRGEIDESRPGGKSARVVGVPGHEHRDRSKSSIARNPRAAGSSGKIEGVQKFKRLVKA